MVTAAKINGRTGAAPGKGRPPAHDVFEEHGTTGLKAQSGLVMDEWLTMLSGQKAVRVYREMLDNCGPIYGLQLAMEMLIRGAEWKVEPANESDSAKRAAELVKSCLDDMTQSFQECVSEGFSSAAFGWCWQELNYKVRRGRVFDDQGREVPEQSSKHDDGMIGWSNIAIRAQESFFRWDFDEDGSGRVRGMWQQSQIDYKLKYIPVEKALVLRPRSRKDSPEGWSLYRGAVPLWHAAKRVQELELIGVYRDLAGVLVVRVPPHIQAAQASDAENYATLQAFELIAQRTGRGEYEGLVFPSSETSDGQKTGYDIELLQSGGSRQNDTDKILRRLDARILMTGLGGVLEVGTGGQPGSFAIGDVHRNMLTTGINGHLITICDAYNRSAIPRLCALNGFEPVDFPKLKHGDVQVPDLTQLGAYIAQLAPHGFIELDDGIKAFLRSFAKLPPPEPGAVPSPSVGNRPTPGSPDPTAPGTQPKHRATAGKVNGRARKAGPQKRSRKRAA